VTIPRTHDEQREAQIDRVLEEAGQQAGTAQEEPAQPDIPPDRTRMFRTTSFSRMRLSWSPADQLVMIEVRRQAEEIIRSEFSEAFELMNEVWAIVRTPEGLDSDGLPLRDGYGHIEWRRSVTGRPLEDWTRLVQSQRERFLYQALSVIFELKQRCADLWGESLFAKAAWEEAFAHGFDAPEGRLTVEDRTSRGRLASMEERYFAIFRSWLSRRADAVVGTVELLCQRLKDTLD
jgi:hypothetical protein